MVIASRPTRRSSIDMPDSLLPKLAGNNGDAA